MQPLTNATLQELQAIQQTCASAESKRLQAYNCQLQEANSLAVQAQALREQAAALLEPTEVELELSQRKRELALQFCREARATYHQPLYRLEFQGKHKNGHTYQCWIDDWDLSESPMVWIRPKDMSFVPIATKSKAGYRSYPALVLPPSDSPFNTCLQVFRTADEAMAAVIKRANEQAVAVFND